MSSDCIVTEISDSDDFSNRESTDTGETEASKEKIHEKHEKRKGREEKEKEKTKEKKEKNFVGGDSSSSLTELQNLIRLLKRGIQKGEPGIKYIKYPNLLVEALEDLDRMIGMDRLKESVALQTVRLIEGLKAGERSPKMLNTILTGPAGVGKTVTGLKLAKIWFALGFLSPKGTTTTTTKRTFFKDGDSNLSYFYLALIVLTFAGSYLLSGLSYAYNSLGLFWTFFLIVLALLLVYLAFTYSDGEWIKEYVRTEKKEEDIKEASDRDIISVVSRNDFVAGYLGQTANKTKELLERNLGKVLFIDEAYSLLEDPRDAYGYECLNTLNLFLSENPDKIVVIFAGYKEHMKSTIFLAQPGLERRCMWNFNIDPYNGEELAEIFFLQAKGDGWEIQSGDREKIKALICRNERVFKNYGGDCGRLVYLSSLDVSKTNLTGISETFLSSEPSKEGPAKKVLTFKNVEMGLRTLQENQFN